jgi:phosphotransferase system HPr-like phosphotransfer protein
MIKKFRNVKEKNMKTCQIKLTSIQDVREFMEIVTRCDFEIDLCSGRYVVDAKSIMGIFSLDLMSAITLTAHTDNSDKLFLELNKFIVK